MSEEKRNPKLSSCLKTGDKMSSEKPPSVPTPEAHLKVPSRDLKTPGKRDRSHSSSSQQYKSSANFNPPHRRHSLPTTSRTTRLLSSDQLPSSTNSKGKRARNKSTEEREADRKKFLAERRKRRMENPFDRPDRSQRRDWCYGRSAKGRKDFRQTYAHTFKDQTPGESSEDD